MRSLTVQQLSCKGQFKHPGNPYGDFDEGKLDTTAYIHGQQETDTFSSDNFDAAQWLQALVDVSRRIANLEELPAVLQSIVSVTTNLVSADAAVIALLDHDQSQLLVKCFIANSNHFEHTHVCDSVNCSIAKRATTEGHALRFPQDQQPDETVWYCPLLVNPIQAAAIVPLKLDNTCIGALIAARRTAEYFTLHDISGLEYLADQTVIALEHATMTSRIQSIAIMEERYRIAREMHDSLAQVLGYLNIQMQTLELLVNAGNTQQVLADIKTARQSIQAAQADVRDSILSLRTTLSDDLPLPVALKEYVLEFGVQTGIDVHFHSTHAEMPRVTPLANVEIVRIVQESLANIRKHAQADTVSMTIEMKENVLEITVADDGVGFDAAAHKQGHFGLRTMKERADHVGGMVTITSSPGRGTTVQLTVPLAL
jgi:signal transduction histidine kinase